MFRISVTTQARKEIKNLKKKHQDAVVSAFEELQENPHAGKPLNRELSGKYSYRIGVYRIIYTINKKDRSVFILSAGHRSVIYT